MTTPSSNTGFSPPRAVLATASIAVLTADLARLMIPNGYARTERGLRPGLVLMRPSFSVYDKFTQAAVHVVDNTSPRSDTARPEADAHITGLHNTALGILTADCVPVLFAAPSAGIVGAAHAGWRGAVDGVLETTIAAMQHAGARLSAIEAVIGPAIQQKSYQVGDDLYQRVLASAPQASRFFTADKGAWQVPL